MKKTFFNPRFLQRFFRELTDAEKGLIREAMGTLPDGGTGEDAAFLMAEFEARRCGLFTVVDGAGEIRSLLFYGVETLKSGRKNAYVLGAVAVKALPDDDFSGAFSTLMEAVAKSVGASSISTRTIRPGLAVKLVEEHGWTASEIVLRRHIA